MMHLSAVGFKSKHISASVPFLVIPKFLRNERMLSLMAAHLDP
jgi:hypothetical protein